MHMCYSGGGEFPLGVSFHMLDPEQRLDTIGLLRGTSVQAVELFEYGFCSDASHVAAAREAFAAAGVWPRTVHADFEPALDISSQDEAIRAAGIQAVAAALDLAAGVGAQIVVLHASSEPIEACARAPRIAQAQRSIDTIKGMAQQAGCLLAIELLPRTCLGNSVAELVQLAAGEDPRAVGVCLDVNHLMGGYRTLPDVVHALGPRLIALHCSDYDGLDEKHWPPMRGVIDWAGFLSALDAIGFAGPLNYEAHLDGDTPAQRLAFLESNYTRLMALAG